MRHLLAIWSRWRPHQWRPHQWRRPLAALILLLGLVFSVASLVQAGQEPVQSDGYVIAGKLVDNQGQPVVEALVTANMPGEEEPLAETESQEDGNWALVLAQEPEAGLTVVIRRPHFQTEIIELSANDLAELLVTGTFGFKEINLQRQVTAGFWAATLIFVAVLLIIAFEKLHSTTAALAGLSAVLLVSFVGVAIWPNLFIFSFERALTYINWEVIFLVMAMMIVMAAYVLWHYRAEWRKQSGGISPALFARLQENARIKDPHALWKSGLVFLLVLAGFVIGEQFHVAPAVPALIEATVLLIWLKPDVHKMITAVDWTTRALPKK